MMRTAFAALAALTIAGCAGNRRPEDGSERGEESVWVMVENDGTIPTQVRVYLLRLGSQEMLLGTMATLGRETLTASTRDFEGTYRLRAESSTGYVLSSPAFHLRGNETIVWVMNRNLIRRSD